MIEKLILSNLIFNEEYSRKTTPFLKPDYFQQNSEKVVFNLIEDFIGKYNKLPTQTALKIELDSVQLSDGDFKNSMELIDSLNNGGVESQEWLMTTTEKFCQDKAIYNAIMEGIQIINGNSNEEKGAIPKILSDALAVSFETSIGHDYILDYMARFERYHRKENKIAFDIDLLNTITNGGLSRKTLNVFMAGTGVGKSMFMCHAAAYNLLNNNNVLYITMEMSEEKVAERIDANLLDTPIQHIALMDEETFTRKIDKLTKKKLGRLLIKEYPTSSAHSGHFRHLLNELKLKKNFIPDIIYIDYLNICASSRYKAGKVNSYEYIKGIAEEIRGLAVEFDVPIVTATQVTRGGFNASDMELTDTSESFGLPATADLMCGLIVTDEHKEMNQVMVKQLKNRYNDVNYFNKFLMGVDRAKMRFYNMDNNANDDSPVFDKSTMGSYDPDTGEIYDKPTTGRIKFG